MAAGSFALYSLKALRVAAGIARNYPATSQERLAF